MAARYNPPPNWPHPPAGWTPPPGWEPDTAWGPPPYGWQLWIEDSPQRGSAYRRHLAVALGFMVGVATLLGYVYFFSAASEGTSTVTSDPDVPNHQNEREALTDRNGSDPGTRSDDPSSQDPAPYAVAPPPPQRSEATRTPSGAHAPSAAPQGPATAQAPPKTATAPRPPRPTASPLRPDPAPTSLKKVPADSGAGVAADPHPTSWSRGRLDPRFGDCAHASKAGYGPYYRGRDAEYSWYLDKDHDGVVCR